MLDTTDQQLLFIVSLAFNALSFFSCIGLLCSHTQSHHSSGPQSKIMVNVVLSNCLISMTGFLAYLLDKDDNFYKINVALSLMALWSSAFWPSALSFLLYKRLAHARAFNSTKFYNYCVFFWMGACVLLPFILTFAVFNLLNINYSPIENRFERATTARESMLVFALMEGVPFMGSILMTLVCSLMQIKALKEFGFSDLIEIQTSRILKYPIAQSCTFLPGLICRTWYLVSPYNSLFLNSIRLFGYYLAGFIGLFVYRAQSLPVQAQNSGFLATKVFPSTRDSPSRATMVDEEDGYEDEMNYREM